MHRAEEMYTFFKTWLGSLDAPDDGKMFHDIPYQMKACLFLLSISQTMNTTKATYRGFPNL